MLSLRIFGLETIPYDEPMATDWDTLRAEESQKPYFQALQQFVREERARYHVYPPEQLTFAALDNCPLAATRVVILGQDPYHGPGQAHGLCFSVLDGTITPPSLRNILKELRDDLGITIPQNGNLLKWAQQGVLLLNTTLTVRAGEAASHVGHGWETFTDEVIRTVQEKEERCVFILWGANARKKKTLITRTHHVIIESAHPSPLSARHGFFGSRPFSRANTALSAAGLPEIDWSLSNS